MKTDPDPAAGPAALNGRFALVPEPAAPFTRTGDSELERLKLRLLRAVLAGVATPALLAPIRRAANEAAALAWLEPHPLLVFPALFEEKLRGVRQRALRQELVRARSANLLAEAA